MSRHLLIVGAGYAGTRLALLAREAGWTVAATTSDAERTEQLRGAGVRVEPWRSSDGAEALRDLVVPGCTVVYSVPTGADGGRGKEGKEWAPPKPAKGLPPLGTPTWHKEDNGLAGDVAAIDAVMRLVRGEGADRFVYLSSTSVYGDHGETWIDEESERSPLSQTGERRREVEDYVLAAADWNVNVVRIVGIYGPGRTLDRYLAGGRYKLVDGGKKLTNRIHVDDLARIILAVAERAPSGPRAYLAADSNPVRVRDLVGWLVEHRGIEWPEEVSLDEYRVARGPDAAARWETTYLASNARVREELGVELRYPDVFAGYEAIFGAS